MLKMSFSLAAAMVLILAIGPGQLARGFSRGPDPLTPQEAAKASNEFGWDLYSHLHKAPGNLFYSPASIELALAMTWAGARDQTAVDMGQTLRLPEAQWQEFETVAKAFGELQDALNPTDESATLAIANRLWGQKGYGFEADYLDLLDRTFGAGLQELDFKGETEASRLLINEWVERQTNDKIQNLLPSGTIDARTRLVLTNAIYFLGEWEKPFEGSDTSDRPFHLGGGEQAKVPTMKQVGKFHYAEDASFQVLSLPYKGGELEMVIALPRQEGGLVDLEASLDQELIDSWMTHREEREVKIFLPKFTLTGEFSLARVLGEMGMGSAFSNGANFSGMTGNKDLAISDVIHKSFVDVYEKGTEAAAATAVVMRLTSMPMTPEDQVLFRADHPFLFFIRDLESGTILFLGRMADPT